MFFHPRQSGQYTVWLIERDKPPLALLTTEILMSLGEFAKGNILIFREDVTQLLKLLTLNLIYTTLHCRYLLQCSFLHRLKISYLILAVICYQCLQGYIMPLFLFLLKFIQTIQLKCLNVSIIVDSVDSIIFCR